MKQFLKNVYLLLFLLMVTGCGDQFLDDDVFPFKGAEMICLGDWNNEAPISVQIFLSKHPLDTSEFKPFEVADVKLFENGNFKESLIYNNGVYISQTNLIPIYGHEYHIEATAENIPSIFSNPVKLPDLVEIDTFELLDLGASDFELNITLDDPDSLGNNYAFNKNYYYEGVYLQQNNREENRKFSRATLIKDTEPNNGYIKKAFRFSNPLYLFSNGNPMPELLPLDEIGIRVFTISNEYIKSFKNESFEFDGFFPNESAYYTNINGGYGLIGTYQVKDNRFSL